MPTLTFAYNHSRDPMNPQDLGDQIATALALSPAPTVDINPTQILVTHASVSAANTAAIQTVINGYVLTPGYSGPAGTPQGNLGVLLAKAANAIASNVTYLGIATPTNPQVVAQVNALTLQVNALIRIVANQLSSTSGT